MTSLWRLRTKTAINSLWPVFKRSLKPYHVWINHTVLETLDAFTKEKLFSPPFFLVSCDIFKQYPQGKKSPNGSLFFWWTLAKSKKCISRDESACPGSSHSSMPTSPLTNLINHDAKICSVSQNIPWIRLKIFENGCWIIAHLYWQRLVWQSKQGIIISLLPSVKVTEYFTPVGHVNSFCRLQNLRTFHGCCPLGVRSSLKCSSYWNNDFMSTQVFYILFSLKDTTSALDCIQSAMRMAKECWPT